MNDTIRLEVTRQVDDFVEQVRDHLADLSEQERDELTDGLAADLADLVAAQGARVLDDPSAYAEELRAAAGLTGSTTARPRRTGLGAWVDANRAGWERVVRRPAAAPLWDLAVALRPAWWALRAWVAVGLALILVGRDGQIAVVPEPGNSRVLGALVLAVAVVVSVQIGRGRLWPGRESDRRRVASRLLLVGLNVLAAAALLPVVDQQVTRGRAEMWYAGMVGSPVRTPGLAMDGRRVRNVFAYDVTGRPVQGVQLFDEQGRPLDVSRATARYRTATGRVLVYPWFNGTQQLWNVFPLPVREQPGRRRPSDVWSSVRPPALPQPPMLVVSPVTLPGQDRGGTEGPRGPKRDANRDANRGGRRPIR